MKYPGPILIAEDDDNDVFFLKYAASQAKLEAPVAVVHDGAKAIAYLKGEGEFSDRAKHGFPSLVVLDIKMPFVSGLEVLKWAREQPAMASLPIVVLSSSSLPSDVEEAYRSGARGYILKPVSYKDWIGVVQAIKKYWLDRAAPPEGSEEWQAFLMKPQGQADSPFPG